MNELASAAARDGKATINQLETYVQEKLQGRVRGMRVLMCDQGLILKGRTKTYYVKQLAQHLVMRETQLPILANEIEVS